ncbi:MAG: hypothetical protein COB50_04255 [Thiotrichales bacterium]|nr:MAG: hypothetical protein COB50_04255 [Thiotrichales bacterium]
MKRLFFRKKTNKNKSGEKEFKQEQEFKQKQEQKKKKKKNLWYIRESRIILSCGFNAEGMDSKLFELAKENFSDAQLYFIKMSNNLFNTLCKSVDLEFDPCDFDIKSLRESLEIKHIPDVLVQLVDCRDEYCRVNSKKEVNLFCKYKTDIVTLINKIIQEDNNKVENLCKFAELLNISKGKVYSGMFVGHAITLYAHRTLCPKYNTLVNNAVSVRDCAKRLTQLQSLVGAGLILEKEYNERVPEVIERARRAGKKEKLVILRDGIMKKIDEIKNAYSLPKNNNKKKIRVFFNKR